MSKPLKTPFQKNLELVLQTLETARTFTGHTETDDHKRQAGLVLAASRWLKERHGLTTRPEVALIGPSYFQTVFIVLELECTYISSDGVVSSDNIFKQYTQEKKLQFPEDVKILNAPCEGKNILIDNPYEREYYSHLVKLALEEVSKNGAGTLPAPLKPSM